jgi:glutamate--cysteine ligase
MNHTNESAGTLDAQRDAIVEYIAKGINHGCGECIGLELEHFIVQKETQTLVPYLDDPETGALGVVSILKQLEPFYDESTYEPQADGFENLIGLSREFANITLEPGAQFEISIGPVLEVRDLDIVYQRFRDELDPLLAAYDYELLSIGYHPTSCAFEIPLIPKERYYFMDKHFKTTGKHGICMMRATASAQVSIDFESERDAIRKFRIANAIGPLLAFVTDNSPVFEGEPLGSAAATRSGLEVPNRMVRTRIWDDVDAQRSMIAPSTFDDVFSFQSYASSILDAPAIFTYSTDSEGVKHNTWQGTTSFAEALAGQTLSKDTIEHILSLFFFDVRLKTYIEIRMADSLPIPYALAFAALIKGLFYREETIQTLNAAFKHVTATAIAQAKTALEKDGYSALVFERPASEWLDELVKLAHEGLSDCEQFYLSPLAYLVESRKTLVDADAEDAD